MTEISGTAHLMAIIQPLIKAIVGADVARAEETKQELIQRNHSMGNPHYGFLIGSHFVSNHTPAQLGKAPRQPLHQDLLVEGSKYMQHTRKIEQDSKRLEQGLLLILRDCETYQDVRDALPDVLREAIPEISSLPRTREEAWTLKDKPLQMHQFQSTKDLIYFYFANRMLF